MKQLRQGAIPVITNLKIFQESTNMKLYSPNVFL